jgi:antitoxin FitA
MSGTCIHVCHMSKMIQIRNVPDQLHATLKARAAMAGTSLSEFILRQLEISAKQPTIEEIVGRLEKLEPVDPQPSASELIREERDSR